MFRDLRRGCYTLIGGLSGSAKTKLVDFILLNADDKKPQGEGYNIDDWPFINNTEFRVANDMWSLVGPRRQLEVDEFNRKVGTYNYLLRRLRAQEQLVNQMVTSYNDKLQKHGR